MKLREIKIKGFKSIGEEQTIPLGDVTMLLGANGAGKSNLVSFFSMLNYMMSGGLNQYVGKHGASQLLYYGPKRTESILSTLEFESEDGCYRYTFKLSHGLAERMFVTGESTIFIRTGAKRGRNFYLTSTDNEIALKNDKRSLSKNIYKMLGGIRTYQFHDTSETAKIKDRILVDDARSLHHDGGNLAAFLRMLQTAYPKHYERIVRRIQTVMPQLGRFDLEPLAVNKEYVRLNWYDTSGSQYLLGPDQISDGSLRFMALAALLLQPKELLPSLIVLDEPELGLHPAAIAELAGMVAIASQNTQVLLATQSTRLVDEFELENIVVVERNAETNSTEFKKLDAPQLEEWLERYSLSELWEKNVLGGQP